MCTVWWVRAVVEGLCVLTRADAAAAALNERCPPLLRPAEGLELTSGFCLGIAVHDCVPNELSCLREVRPRAREREASEVEGRGGRSSFDMSSSTRLFTSKEGESAVSGRVSSGGATRREGLSGRAAFASSEKNRRP
jgi:hypothetical protein